MKGKLIGIGLIALLVWGAVAFFIGTPWPWKLWTAKQESAAYLEAKYGEPFTVGMPSFWIMDGNYHAQASPKSHPLLIFYVGTEQGAEGIQDNYESTRKQYVIEQTTEWLIGQEFSEEAMTVAVHAEVGLSGQSGYEYVLYITLYEREQSLQQINSRLYQLIPQLQKMPVNEVKISLRYKDKKLELWRDEQVGSEEELLGLWE